MSAAFKSRLLRVWLAVAIYGLCATAVHVTPLVYAHLGFLDAFLTGCAFTFLGMDWSSRIVAEYRKTLIAVALPTTREER